MEKITFINAMGEQITFDTKEYRLLKLSGTGAVQTDIQTQKSPFQDGRTYLSNALEPRTIDMEIGIFAQDKEVLFAKRRLISRIFNPKLGPGRLIYEYYGGIKEIEAISELAPAFATGSENETNTFQRALITLLCPSPFWLDPGENTVEIVTWIGGMTFPLTFPTKFSTKAKEPRRLITNSGDVPTPVEIGFKGPATNPKITNLSTGEYIQVLKTIYSGETLIITTDFGNKRVEIEDTDGNRSNAFHYIDLNSVFWSLEPGDNLIEYSSDDPSEPAAVYIKHRNRYVGI